MSGLITISDSTHQHDHVNKMGMRGYTKMWDTPTIKGVDSGQQEQVGTTRMYTVMQDSKISFSKWSRPVNRAVQNTSDSWGFHSWKLAEFGRFSTSSFVNVVKPCKTH